MIQRLGPLALLTSLMAAGCPNTCAVKLDDGVGLPCDNNEACLPGTYCAEDKTCQPGDPADAAAADGGVVVEGGTTDASEVDAAVQDGASPDTPVAPDAGEHDALLPDGAVSDAVAIDAASIDGASVDAATFDAQADDGALEDAAGSPDLVVADSTTQDVWTDDGATALDAAVSDAALPDLLTGDAARADSSAVDANSCYDAAGLGYAVDPVNDSTIGQRVPIRITFDQPVNQGPLTLGGELGSVSDSGVWLSATELVISPITLWQGGLQGLDFQVEDLCGESVAVSLSYVVQRVVPLYPNNGLNWNDYLLNDGADVFSAADVACVGDETGSADACIHGGELRLFYVENAADCVDLSAADGLDAFEWNCMIETESGLPVFVSTGLKQGAALSDLIDFNGARWLVNSVQVLQGSDEIDLTLDETWWFNPVQEITGGSDLIGGTIHLVKTDPGAAQVFSADKAALLVAPGVTLTTDPAIPEEFVISAGDLSFLWIEGALSGEGDDIGIAFDNVTFSALRRVTVSRVDTGTYQHAIELYQGGRNRLEDITITNQRYEGLVLTGATRENVIRRVAVEGGGSPFAIAISVVGNAQRNHLSGLLGTNCEIGLDIENDAHDNIIQDARFSSCGDSCVKLAVSAAGNLLLNVIASNSVAGITLSSGAHDNTLLNVTANSSAYGVRIDSSGVGPRVHNLFVNLATMNNDRNLSIAAPSFGNSVIGLVAGNGDYGVDLGNASPTFFHGLLKVGSNSVDDCAVADTGLGIEDNCDNSAGSTATLSSGIIMDRTFLGPVNDDDAANPIDVSGSGTHEHITDWFSFENPFRVWGLDDSDYPSDDSRQACKSGTMCRIYDWRLASGDPGDDSSPVALGALVRTTGDDTFSHQWSDASTSVFLAHAVELIGDGIGDDDGLCESDEACLYTPNLGAYQGHGPLIRDTFVAGTITGVTLYRYQDNGAP